MAEVVSMKTTVQDKIEAEIVEALSNRAGKWVSEPFLLRIAEREATPFVPAKEVLGRMMFQGKLEQHLVNLEDKFGNPIQAPMYRLVSQL